MLYVLSNILCMIGYDIYVVVYSIILVEKNE